MASQTTVDLLRHGELEGERVFCGITDRKLTKHGWVQMQQACDKNDHWQMIVSSPLSRCALFAKQLSQKLDLPLIIDARWQEMNFGQWDGLSALEIIKNNEELLHRFWKNPLEATPPGAEPLRIVQSRVLEAWEEIVTKQISTLVISHGGPIRIIRCHTENHPVEKLLEIDVQYAEMYSINTSHNVKEQIT